MNRTLQNAKELLNERYHIDSKDSGSMSEYNRRCATQLRYVSAELEAQLINANLLKKQIEYLNEKLAELEK